VGLSGNGLVGPSRGGQRENGRGRLQAPVPVGVTKEVTIVKTDKNSSSPLPHQRRLLIIGLIAGLYVLACDKPSQRQLSGPELTVTYSALATSVIAPDGAANGGRRGCFAPAAAGQSTPLEQSRTRQYRDTDQSQLANQHRPDSPTPCPARQR
jgi:hypothetical protein